MRRLPVASTLLLASIANGKGLLAQTDSGSLFNRATSDARALGHDWVGAEHLLLGVVQSRSCSADLLAAAGLTADRARAEIRKLLHGPVA
jgi:hypothetical protein